MQTNEIIITVSGGVVQDVQIPAGLNVRVKVKDYDTEHSDAETGYTILEDEQGYYEENIFV